MAEKEIKKLSILSTFGLARSGNEFIESLTMMIDSGMGIVEALDSIEKETTSARMRRVVRFIRAEIDAGAPLWLVLEKTGIFPRNIIAMIKVGEESGRMIETLRTVTNQQEKEWEFRSKVRSAMLYPVFVFCFVIVIGTIAGWYVLPKLSETFAALNVPLPALTRLVIKVGVFMGKYGYIVVPLFFAVVLSLIYFFFSFPKTKYIGQILLFAIPGVKNLVKQVELARLGYILGNQIKVGIPIVDALHSMQESTTIKSYQKFYSYLSESVRDGNSFEKSFKAYHSSEKLIPPSMQQMIITGEKSGSLAEILIKIGLRYESRTESFAKDLANVLEPILLVFLGLIVAILAISIIAPIYSLVNYF